MPIFHVSAIVQTMDCVIVGRACASKAMLVMIALKS